MWGLDRAIVRALFDVRASGIEHWPEPPFQLVANHHNGLDPLLVLASRAGRAAHHLVRADARPTSAAASRTG